MNSNKYVTRMLTMAAIGQAINAVESIRSIDQYRPDAFLRGRAAQSETSQLPLKFRQLMDTTAGVFAIHAANVVAPVLVMTGRNSRKRQTAAATISLVANKLFETRNPYGRDGSDQMQGVIYGYRVATALIPSAERADDLFLRAVNAQLCVSYSASGLAKLISSDWRSGRALELIVRTDIYGGTWFARLVGSRPMIGKILSWSTIAWESSYPLVYMTNPSAARGALSMAKAFHLGIAYTMGLPRFFWTFGAAHPAAEYVIDRRALRAF